MQLEVDLDAIELLQPAFGKAPETLDAIDVDIPSLSELVLCMAHPQVSVISHVHQTIIASPTIAVDDAGRVDLPANDRLKCRFLTVWHDLRIDMTLAQEDAKDRLFSRSSPSFEFTVHPSNAGGAEVALIQLYVSHHALKLFELVTINGQTEQTVVAVDRVAIDVSQPSGLTGCDVNAKVPHDFSNLVPADWLIFCSLHSDSLYPSLV